MGVASLGALGNRLSANVNNDDLFIQHFGVDNHPRISCKNEEVKAAVINQFVVRIMRIL